MLVIAPASVATIAKRGEESLRMIGFIACPNMQKGRPRVIQKKYSRLRLQVSSLTLPPKRVKSGSIRRRQSAVSTRLLTMVRTMAFPTDFSAFSLFPSPSEMLTKAQAPSPSITAIARARTVSGKTTVFAALPLDPRQEALAMQIWSTML